MSSDKQCAFFQLLGRLVCRSVREVQQASDDIILCPSCDLDQELTNPASLNVDQNIYKFIFETFASATKQNRSFKSKKSRVAAMTIIPRLLRHTHDKIYLDLKASYLGQYCVGALRSSVRELRVAAG